MFELLDRIEEARQAIAHVSEITGLSVTLLVALAALAYLEPTIRTWCVRWAIVVLGAYLLVMGGYRLGAEDKQAAWDAANAIAAQQAARRDARAAEQATTDESTATESLNEAAKGDKEQTYALRKSDADCHPITPDELR